jgi:hypothetical protein
VEIVIKRVKDQSFKNGRIFHEASSKSELTLVSGLSRTGKTILRQILRQRISVRLSQILHQRFSMRVPQILRGLRALSFSRNFEENSFSSISCDDSTGSDDSALTVDC